MKSFLFASAVVLILTGTAMASQGPKATGGALFQAARSTTPRDCQLMHPGPLLPIERGNIQIHAAS